MTIPEPRVDPIFGYLSTISTGVNADEEQYSIEDSGNVLSELPATLPSPANPMAVARVLEGDWQFHGLPTLRSWRGTWMRWVGPHWVEIDDAAIRADLYPRLEFARYVAIDKTGAKKEMDWAPTRGKVANLIEAIAAITHLPLDVEMPSWLAAPDREGEHTQVIACRNGLLNVETRTLNPLTPAYFNRVSVPFDYEPEAKQPERWLGFLQSLWPNDPDAIAALQEFFGYVLSGRNDLQKMVLIIGPPRSGKGTIARTLTDLIGKANMTGPTMSSLTTNFGLADLIGKSLAIVADGRLPRQGAETIVERLLLISGDDTITVDRKHKEPWNGKIPARFMLLSNELPAFADASGAIASRLIVLTMTNSFLGMEDTTLDRDIKRELPGIFNWSLEGLARLTERGRFVEPASSAEAVAMLAAAVSPIKTFLKERCIVGPDEQVATELLFETWKDWCDLSGRDRKGTKETFGRNLLAAIPGLRRSKRRDAGVQVPTYVGVRLMSSQEREEAP
ncbi:putative DNA primase/helicase [Streptomyces sp. TLI_235]|nr:phage/plasmid primase, P4 family [Streptomyces sp. TLI_235]PBC77594.1 putative DNA primase/helicase [Streptomyces sp. TLI_235]